MDAKSVITSPSPQMPIEHGRWSSWLFRASRGPDTVKSPVWMCPKMAASLGKPRDLGKQGDTKALTRFYLDTQWDGKPMLLQARAMDETGYVQPTKDAAARRCAARTLSTTTTVSKLGT